MGKYGIIIAITIGFSVLDILTGYIGAVIRKKVKSSTMRKGLLKKFILICIIAVSVLIQLAQNYVDLGFNVPTIGVTCVFIILMEITSIIENADEIFDGKIKELFSKLKGNGNDEKH